MLADHRGDGHALEFVRYLAVKHSSFSCKKASRNMTTAQFVYQSTKFNFNIATRGQHVT